MSTSKSELDVVIAEVKEQFRLFLAKRRDLILKLGNAYEKMVMDASSICEEIKNVLHEKLPKNSSLGEILNDIVRINGSRNLSPRTTICRSLLLKMAVPLERWRRNNRIKRLKIKSS